MFGLMWGRRSVLGGMIAATGALAGGPALPAKPALRKSHRLPPRLRKGDVVGLVEPAGFTEGPPVLDYVKHTIEGMGLVPRFGAHVGERFGYLAGTDADRAADIDAMFSDPDVRAIMAVRGGWGSARILPLLDWDAIRANPKLLIGFSDVTALHLAIAARAHFPTIHGPVGLSSWPKVSWESFWRMAFSGETPTLPLAREGEPVTTLGRGNATGRLLGGNLSVLTTMGGSPWLPDFEGAILFLEDVGEAPYRIDRMLNQLSLAGVLGKVSGVIFGECTRCVADEPDYAGFTVADLMDQYIVPLGVPALAGANIGHVRGQVCLPSGGMVELDADAATLRLIEPVAGA
ncbi:LD-carboxypeptidase [Novosphingobium sp. ZN18A2]|uniref:S66 peptidase family protein n=1 Tax=Novosphingobium sp. ZN18A2 TaxID=3079861 RepID=UPI0030D568C7